MIVVYHVASMGGWQEVVRDQLNLLVASGLSRFPLYVTHVGPLSDTDWLFKEACSRGLQPMLERRDDNLLHYETFAMLLIERLAKREKTNEPILYFHTKGVSASWHEGKKHWRRLMDREVIANWQDNLAAIETGEIDVVGVNWLAYTDPHFSGNFWIARADWIRKLPDFVGYHASRKFVRTNCEFWIGAAPGIRPKSLCCEGHRFWEDNYDWSQHFSSAEPACTPADLKATNTVRCSAVAPTIPIFVNNCNRLTTTKAMVEFLRQVPDAAPIIVDNGSTYPPLLTWYESAGDLEIIRLGRNAGPYAPWECRPDLRESSYYVVTDSDLDLSGVPLDLLKMLRSGLDLYPDAVKAGLSLSIDDLPPPFLDAVRQQEAERSLEKLADGWWRCSIDTTFAMYRPGATWGGTRNSIRVDQPYVAKHAPWYLTAENMTLEDVYYRDHCEHAFSSYANRMPTTFTPNCTSARAEWHLTYRCNLACVSCNRLCFLPPRTPDMTLEDARQFVRQAKDLNWAPTIIIIGGEPTLHPEFFEFLAIARELSGSRVIVYSNGFSDGTRVKLDEVRCKGLAVVDEGTFKPTGSIIQPVNDYFLAPVDFGMKGRTPCSQHSCMGRCGISVDAAGYTICPLGGAFDSYLKLGIRTRRLADLFDGQFTNRQTEALCNCCGSELGISAEKIASSQVVCGALMSPTWLGAVADGHEHIARIFRPDNKQRSG